MPVLVADSSRIADGNDLTEALESVLVELQNQRITQTAPDCPRDFDMFVVGDRLRIEDEVGLTYEPSRGDVLNSVVGILHFSFERQKVIPRSDDDIDWVYCGGEPDKCEPTECVVDETAQESGQLVITEIQDDPRGRDTGREFIELYNPSDRSISLDGWWIQNCADLRVDLAGRVSAREAFVVAGSQNQGENGGFRADGLLGDFQISNGAGSILLFDSNGDLVDQVRYSESADWPNRETGDSLELRDTTLDNRLGASWRAARDQYGNGGRGTPGRVPR